MLRICCYVSNLHFTYLRLRSGPHFPRKSFYLLQWSPLKMMKNAFYFIIKVLPFSKSFCLDIKWGSVFEKSFIWVSNFIKVSNLVTVYFDSLTLDIESFDFENLKAVCKISVVKFWKAILQIVFINPFLTEAVAKRCSVKQLFLKIPQSSQENTCARVSCLQLKSSNVRKTALCL